MKLRGDVEQALPTITPQKKEELTQQANILDEDPQVLGNEEGRQLITGIKNLLDHTVQRPEKPKDSGKLGEWSAKFEEWGKKFEKLKEGLPVVGSALLSIAAKMFQKTEWLRDILLNASESTVALFKELGKTFPYLLSMTPQAQETFVQKLKNGAIAIANAQGKNRLEMNAYELLKQVIATVKSGGRAVDNPSFIVEADKVIADLVAAAQPKPTASQQPSPSQVTSNPSTPAPGQAPTSAPQGGKA